MQNVLTQLVRLRVLRIHHLPTHVLDWVARAHRRFQNVAHGCGLGGLDLLTLGIRGRFVAVPCVLCYRASALFAAKLLALGVQQLHRSVVLAHERITLLFQLLQRSLCPRELLWTERRRPKSLLVRSRYFLALVLYLLLEVLQLQAGLARVQRRAALRFASSLHPGLPRSRRMVQSLRPLVDLALCLCQLLLLAQQARLQRGEPAL